MVPSVLIDFDGTVVLEDTTDLVLESFADPAWRAVEADWVAGRIGSHECLARQIDLVCATSAELDRLADQATIDPDFADFVATARKLGLRMLVGSDGFDRIIHRVLGRAGVELPIVSNRLVAVGNDRWRAEFPNFREQCRSQSGNCKCTPFDMPGPRILIGDGRSDFCPAGQATLVLAKNALVKHCVKSDIDHIAIDGFADATRALGAVFRERRLSVGAPTATVHA